MNPADTINVGIGFVVTLMVLSYIIGDNFLFRFATHLFIGISAAYIALIVLYQVIMPQLAIPLINGTDEERTLMLIPLLLGLLLLTKLSPRLAWLGNLPMGFLVGGAAAAVVGGAVLGTIVPQIQDTINAFDLQRGGAAGISFEGQLFGGTVIVIGTLTTLIHFTFSVPAKQGEKGLGNSIVNIFRKIGQYFIAIIFGALFAGVYMAALTALIDRLSFIVDFIEKYFLS